VKALGLCAAFLLPTVETAGAIEWHVPPLPRAEIASRHIVMGPCDAAVGCTVELHATAGSIADPAQTPSAERTIFLQRSGTVVVVTSLGRTSPDRSRRVVVDEPASVTADPAACPELVVC
jgi:hypothetical protein